MHITNDVFLLSGVRIIVVHRIFATPTMLMKTLILLSPEVSSLVHNEGGLSTGLTAMSF